MAIIDIEKMKQLIDEKKANVIISTGKRKLGLGKYSRDIKTSIQILKERRKSLNRWYW